MPEGVKLSYKSETLHKHVEYCMCYHSRIASGQRADALLGDWLSSFFFPFMKAQDDVVRLGAGHLLTYHMSMALTKARVCDGQSQVEQLANGWWKSTEGLFLSDWTSG